MWLSLIQAKLMKIKYTPDILSETESVVTIFCYDSSNREIYHGYLQHGVIEFDKNLLGSINMEIPTCCYLYSDSENYGSTSYLIELRIEGYNNEIINEFKIHGIFHLNEKDDGVICDGEISNIEKVNA